ncbi:hypothetical protein K3495_g3861 [Podosphaera aphanis]|nr:hypothetical protein K3495_g3861 [Podosphaera aphanis]
MQFPLAVLAFIVAIFFKNAIGSGGYGKSIIKTKSGVTLEFFKIFPPDNVIRQRPIYGFVCRGDKSDEATSPEIVYQYKLVEPVLRKGCEQLKGRLSRSLPAFPTNLKFVPFTRPGPKYRIHMRKLAVAKNSWGNKILTNDLAIMNEDCSSAGLVRETIVSPKSGGLLSKKEKKTRPDYSPCVTYLVGE